MLQRAISGAVFVAIMVGCTLLGQPFLYLLFVLIYVLGVLEFFNAFIGKKQDLQILRMLSLFAGAVALLLVHLLTTELSSQWWSLLPAIIFLPLLAGLFSKAEALHKHLSSIYLQYFYVWFPLALLLFWTRENGHYTHLYLLGGMLIIWTNDSFAYLTGRFLGKRKLFERISPNKTIEGTLGGLLFAMLAAYIYAWSTGQNTAAWLGFGLLMGICATLGDLVESMFKRSLGLKDMGSLMPGHGGVLDRFDALFFAAPFGWTYIEIFLR